MSDKKSWRDIDRQREQSDHRKGDRQGSGRSPRVESATAAYKKTLDAFFDKGVVPEHLKGKLPAGSNEGPSERQTLIRAVREAQSGKPLEKSLDALIDQFGLPDDPDIWLLALGHSKDPVLRDTLAKIEEYVNSGQLLPRQARFVERLKGLEFSSFDPRVQTKAASLANRLR